MSHATIVSLCPASITCSLPHTTPSRIAIPAGSFEEPILAVFSDGEERKYTGIGTNAKDPWTKYPVVSFDLAKTIVDDYKKSATYVEPDSYPGVFVVVDKPDFVIVPKNDVVYVTTNSTSQDTINKFVAKFPEELALAKRQQYNWFKKLVQVADKSFAKNSNYAEISTLQRYASKVLNLERPWNKEIRPEDFRKCPFCASFVDPGAVICKECHNVVDQAGYDALKKPSVANKVG